MGISAQVATVKSREERQTRKRGSVAVTMVEEIIFGVVCWREGGGQGYENFLVSF